MNKGNWAMAALLGLVLGSLTVPASAAPAVGAGARSINEAASEASPVDRATYYRRCWYDSRGRRHCRRLLYRYYDYDYGYAPYYYGPGIGFYFGGGHRHHHHHRGHGGHGGHHHGGHGGHRGHR